MEPMEVDGVSGKQRIFCWGKSASGELGIPNGGTEKIAKEPTLMSYFSEINSSKVAQIACGKQHSVFLLENGLVYSCGMNGYRQLGLGHDKNGSQPAKIETLEPHRIIQIACGEFFTVVLNSEHHLFSFGSNTLGQLGHESDGKRPKRIRTFIPAYRDLKVVQVSCGAAHCLALTACGRVYSWGDNKNGQLGHGNTSKKKVEFPTEIGAISNLPVYMVVAGGSHSIVMTVSGTLFAWGKNSFGQLGIGDEKDRNVPTLVTSLRKKGVRYVACGEEHTAVLTKSGRVFTFGYGVTGQLGHGHPENESNPKQILELTGDTVTQIACGRWHTLAYIESSGRLYSFGMNKDGQLGNGTTDQQVTPTVVEGEWKKYLRQNENNVTDDTVLLADLQENNLVDRMNKKTGNQFYIQKMFSGGNQNFVLLEQQKTQISPLDMRHIHLNNKTTTFLTASKVENLVKQCNDGGNEKSIKQALDVISTVFSSPSCLNGSFLDLDNHEQTGLQNHGLNMECIVRGKHEEPEVHVRLMLLRLLSYRPIREKIDKTINDLLKNLRKMPPDLECLRVYLLLPEVALYEEPLNHYSYIAEVGEKILELDTDAQRILCVWWSRLPATLFSKIITAFKSCVKDVMKDFNPMHSTHEKWKNVQVSLFVLQILNKVNDEANFKIPYEAFYIPIIQQKIDISLDYRLLRHHPDSFCFCRFPFTLDVQAKSKIIQTDADLKMKMAVDKSMNENLQAQMHNMLPHNNPFLVFHIRRNHLVQDTLRHIESVKKGVRTRSDEEARWEFMKPLKIVFEGEEGIDAGGPKKEFFLLLTERIFGKEYGMFTENKSSMSVWFNPQSFEEPHMYYLIGVICGLALYNSIIIDVHFPPVLYKKLLGQEPNLEDFRGFDPDYARTLEYLLNYEEQYEGAIDEIFGQNFQRMEESYGETKIVDLIENGANIYVKKENRKQYVSLVVDYILTKSIASQYEEFRKGFFSVCDIDILGILRPKELMEMISGCEDYDDFMQLKEGAKYEGEYHENHPVIANFWNVLENFDVDLKKKFLGFLTGSDKIPIHGIKSLKILIRPLIRPDQPGAPDEQQLLPEAQTCFNHFALPRYATIELMEEKLKIALNDFNKGFGLE